jgi:hypothetical protein
VVDSFQPSSGPTQADNGHNGRKVCVNDLHSLRKEAKFWLKQVRSNHSGFSKRFRLAYPGAPGQPTLRDIQEFVLGGSPPRCAGTIVWPVGRK